MIKILVSGVLGNDAEIKEFGKRKAVNFSVAVHKDYKNSKGEKVEKTDWMNAVIWKNADQSIKVAEFLKKGKRVFIEGEPGVDAYLSKEGEAKGALTINVKNLEFIS